MYRPWLRDHKGVRPVDHTRRGGTYSPFPRDRRDSPSHIGPDPSAPAAPLRPALDRKWTGGRNRPAHRLDPAPGVLDLPGPGPRDPPRAGRARRHRLPGARAVRSRPPGHRRRTGGGPARPRGALGDRLETPHRRTHRAPSGLRAPGRGPRRDRRPADGPPGPGSLRRGARRRLGAPRVEPRTRRFDRELRPRLSGLRRDPDPLRPPRRRLPGNGRPAPLRHRHAVPGPLPRPAPSPPWLRWHTCSFPPRARASRSPCPNSSAPSS